MKMVDLNLHIFVRDKLRNKKIVLIKDEIEAQIKVILKKYSNPAKKFILLSTGRSGTELLRKMINIHPEIYCDREIFLKQKAFFPKKYLENRSRIYGRSIYGYKAKVTQLQKQYKNEKDVKEKFLSDEYQIIYVSRTNFLRQAISGLVSNQRQQWHDTKAAPLREKKFEIDCERLLKKMAWIEKCDKREKEMLEGLEYLSIVYEKDLLVQKNHQKTLDKVFHYLGVDSVTVKAPLKKTTPKELRDFIENHEEVKDSLKGTKYAVFLE